VSSLLHFLKIPPDASLERNRLPTKMCFFMKSIFSISVAYVLFDSITCPPETFGSLDLTYFVEEKSFAKSNGCWMSQEVLRISCNCIYRAVLKTARHWSLHIVR